MADIKGTEILEDKRRFEVKNDSQNNFAIIGFLLLGLIFSGVWVYCFKSLWEEGLSSDLYSALESIILYMALLILALCLLVASLKLLLDKYSKVSITKDGLIVKYPLSRQNLVKWDEFYVVCLCLSSIVATRGIDGDAVICFIKKGEKTNMLGRWKTDNPFHLRRMVCVYYSDELFEATRRWCPIPVIDAYNTISYSNYL